MDLREKIATTVWGQHAGLGQTIHADDAYNIADIIMSEVTQHYLSSVSWYNQEIEGLKQRCEELEVSLMLRKRSFAHDVYLHGGTTTTPARKIAHKTEKD